MHPQTNRGSEDEKRGLFKKVSREKLEPGQAFLKSIFFRTLFKSAAASKNYYQRPNMEGSTASVSYFWAESVTKAVTSQLCFHRRV